MTQIYVLGVERYDYDKNGSRMKGCTVHIMNKSLNEDNRRGDIPGKLTGNYEVYEQFSKPGNYDVTGTLSAQGKLRVSAMKLAG